MNKRKIKNIVYFTKGHRGLLYIGDYKKKKVVIKRERKDSKAIDRIKNEIKFLKILNKKGIGAKLLFYDKKKFDYFVCYYIEGDFFPTFIGKSTDKNLIKRIIKNIFVQCFKMDKLRITKEEMNHPYKHIIIEKKTKKPILIDFERCHLTKEPVNATQFSSYLISCSIRSLLEKKGIKVNREKIIASARRYKKEANRNNLNEIIGSIS